MNFRIMKESDLSEVYQIEQSLFSKPWSVRDFFDAINNENNIYIVAEEQEEILGYCGVWGVVGEGQITNVAIKKEKQGMGIATKLLSFVIKEGEEQGLTAFTLEVRVTNLSAIHLYKKLGFQSAGIRKNFYECPTEDAMIMWKKESGVL